MPLNKKDIKLGIYFRKELDSYGGVGELHTATQFPLDKSLMKQRVESLIIIHVPTFDSQKIFAKIGSCPEDLKEPALTSIPYIVGLKADN